MKIETVNEIEQLAEQHSMTVEFVTWFFNEKKAGCGNVWFMMLAAMWEGWKGRGAELTAALATIEKCREITNCPAGVDLQDHLRQLAAENVGLKAAFSPEEIPAEAVDAFMDTAVMDHDWNDTSEWSWVENETEVIRAVLDALKPETPATDRIVAGIKAEGAEACFRALVTSDDDDFSDAPNICAMVAFQLREGAK